MRLDLFICLVYFCVCFVWSYLFDYMYALVIACGGVLLAVMCLFCLYVLILCLYFAFGLDVNRFGCSGYC